MSITQVLQGCGAWDVRFTGKLPPSVRERITPGSTVLVFPHTVVETELASTDTDGAIFHGIITRTSRGFISGWELSWLLSKPNGDSAYESAHTPADQAFNGFPMWSTFTIGGSWSLADKMSGSLPVNGITAGQIEDTAFASSGLGSVSPTTDRRTKEGRWALDEKMAVYAELLSEVLSWRINVDMTLDADVREDLYRQGEVVICEAAAEWHGGQLMSVAGEFESVTSIEAVATEIIAVGERDVGGTDEITESRVTQGAGFTAPDGSALNMRRVVDAGGNNLALSDLALNTAALSTTRRTATVSKITSSDITKHIAPGDLVYVWAPDEGWIDSGASPIEHLGQTIRPDTAWVRKLTWNVQRGMSVVVRTPNGADFIDVTDWVQFGSDDVAVDLMDTWAPPWMEGAPARFDRLGDEATLVSRIASR